MEIKDLDVDEEADFVEMDEKEWHATREQLAPGCYRKKCLNQRSE